jgi:hypothetical protein
VLVPAHHCLLVECQRYWPRKMASMLIRSMQASGVQ